MILRGKNDPDRLRVTLSFLQLGDMSGIHPIPCQMLKWPINLTAHKIVLSPTNMHE